MPKEYLDSKVNKAIIKIDKNVSDIKSIIGDLIPNCFYTITL